MQDVANALSTMNRDHSTVLLVEQNFHMATQVGDQYFIIDDGLAVHQGAMADLAADAALQARYLGLALVLDELIKAVWAWTCSP